MAALDFPDPSASPWTGSNGVVYKYIGVAPNGYWTGHNVDETSDQLDARYVQKSGDTMTGSLNWDYLGDVDTFILPDGRATFAGQTQHLDGLAVENNDLTVGGSNAVISPDGTADFAGQTTHAGGVSVTGNISGGGTGIHSSGKIQVEVNSLSNNILKPFHSGIELGTYNADAQGFYAHQSLVTRNVNNDSYGFYSDLRAKTVGSSGRSFGFYQNNTAGTSSVELYAFYSDLTYRNDLGTDESRDGTIKYAFYANGDVPSYFGGLTEHAGGVKLPPDINITLGDQGTSTVINTTSSGEFKIYSNSYSNTLFASRGSRGNIALGSDNYNSGMTVNVINNNNVGCINGVLDLSKVQNIGDKIYNSPKSIAAILKLSNVNAEFISCYSASSDPGFLQNSRVKNQIGYLANSQIENAYNNYGFYSNISTQRASHGGGGANYNFYAAGDAPNYFRGNLKVGGTLAQANIGIPGYGNNDTGVGIQAIGTVNISNPDSTSLRLNRNTTGTLIELRTAGSSSPAGSVDVTGTQSSVYSCGQTAVNSGFISTSDYRLKENIVDLPSSTELVKQLKPKSFNYIGSSETVQGFVAHELQEVNTFYATGTKDATEPVGTLTDYDGTELETNVVEPEDLTYEEQVEATPYIPADPDNNVEEQEATYTTVTRTKTWTPTGTQPVYQGVDQTKLIPLLTKALQEALDKIETLETRLADAGIA